MRTPRAFSVWWMGLIVGCVAVMAASRAFAQPVAVNDSYSTPQSTAITVQAPGVLANDSGGPGRQVVNVTPVTNGILFPGADGAFFYQPNIGFAGNDAFTYQVSDGGLLSNVATVTISVVPPNSPPVATDDAFAVDEGQTLNAGAPGVLGNDTDANSNPLTAFLISGVSTGTLTALQPNGSFSFTPPSPEFNGTTSFTYQADDGTARSNTATVTITVNAVNDTPAAQPDSYTTVEDTEISVPANGVLGNDTDPDGDTLTAEVAGNVSSGALQLGPNGSFVYRPLPDFNGTASFTYRAKDAAAQSAPVTVTISVTPVNDAPRVTSPRPLPTIDEGATFRYELIATDPDGTTPTISAPTLPAWLAFTPPNAISGTPAEANIGVHNVTMSVTDGIAPAVTFQFQITVENVDIAPAIRTIPEQTATENSPFDLDLTQFVTDSDTAAASLTYAATSGVPPGLSLSAAGHLSGTPQITDSVGTHTVRFTVKDTGEPVSGQFRLVVVPAGRVDLGVTMNVSPSPVPLDTPATWTLTVTNRAPQVAAEGASLDVTFVGEVPFVFDAPPAGCTLTPAGDQTNLACAIGALAGGASTAIALTGRGGFAGDVFASAKVAVVGTGLDETSGNDTTTASLSIAQRVSAKPAQRITLADARAAAAGDFNADGFDDLVVATASPLGVVLFTNVADPANPGRRVFATPPQTVGGEALTTDVAVVDLDRDGDLDIVTAAGNGAPDRAFVNAGGTFTSVALGNAAVESRAVAAGDINGDAFIDLVFAGPVTSTVFLNTGSGAAFTPGAGIGPHDARDVLLVDLSGDTLPELVLANAGGDAAVYRNAGGAFTLDALLATAATSAVAAGDFNADTRPDLVFARDTAQPPTTVPSALVWLNASGAAGQFFVSDELGAAATTALLVRDFNVDTRADVLALNGNGVRIFTNAGAGNGTFALHPQQLATPGARGAAAGKFNNDDRVDLAVVGDGVTLFINDGEANFGEPDSNAPVIQLRGDATVNIIIDAPYSDAGATATDKEDGDITSRIVVTNPVNNALLGTYTVTYAVSDLAGNPAAPVTRTVNVQPQPAATDGGGGGAVGLETLLALLIGSAFAARRRRKPE
jgi:hypothetical protein